MSAPSPGLRQALEDALVADPDDLAAHMAYADVLSDEGDPRGELIQVQLALENDGLEVDERRRLRAREKELLRTHAAQWLGELAMLLPAHPWLLKIRFARGWLDTLELDRCDDELAAVLAREPAARLLRVLVLRDVSGSFGAAAGTLRTLRKAVFLSSLRAFQCGTDPDEGGVVRVHSDPGVLDLVAALPRLEDLRLFVHRLDGERLFSLPNLTRLRVLQPYFLDDYPLARLAADPERGVHLTHLLLRPAPFEPRPGREPPIRTADLEALLRSPFLPNLTHLQLRYLEQGDEAVRLIVRSGILKRLKVLDLQHGVITDVGAFLLARTPHAAALEKLELSSNALTRRGVAALESAGAAVFAERQHALGDADWRRQTDTE